MMRSVNSEAQKAAARENGKKGGRPRKLDAGDLDQAERSKARMLKEQEDMVKRMEGYEDQGI